MYSMYWMYRTLHDLTLSHRLNVETALLPVIAEPAQPALACFKADGRTNDQNRTCLSEIHQAVKPVQCCLCYYQNLLNQLSWFYYKNAHFSNTEAIESDVYPLFLTY